MAYGVILATCRYNLTRIVMTFLTAFIYAAIYWKQGNVGACAGAASISHTPQHLS